MRHRWTLLLGSAFLVPSDRVFHWLTPSRSASPILPTAPAPDPRLSHAELAPGKFVSPRSQGRSCFFGQRLPPVRDARAENECAGLGVPPLDSSFQRLRSC